MKRKWILILGGVVALAALIAIPASTAADRGGRTFKADLDGFHEVPAISTTGTGHLELRKNDDGTELDFDLSWDNIQGGNILFAHIHLGQEDVNGGVIAFLCGGGGQAACQNSPSGSASGTITAANVIGPANQGIAAGEFSEALTALSEGVVYGNLHTTQFPGGEIRGQLK
jgi:hypothetical protein